MSNGSDREAQVRRFVAGARSLAAQKRARQNQQNQPKDQENQAPDQTPADEPVELCCKGVVHIAYRGIADDRMYMCYSRAWAELRYFRQNGLRVFCADCRTRLI